MTILDVDLLRESLKIDRVVYIKANDELCKVIRFNNYIYVIEQDNYSPHCFADFDEFKHRFELFNENVILLRVVL